MAQEFYQKYYNGLIGYTITSVNIEQDEDGTLWPKFIAKRKGHPDLELVLSRDEEGNGAGFMFGLPIPEKT